MDVLSRIDGDVLGEVCGIFAGDGTLYKTKNGHVIEVRGSSREKKYYSENVKPKFEKLLSKNLKLTKRCYPGGHVVGIRICTKEAIKLFHEELGFPIGKKSRIVRVPDIVFNDERCWKGYIRGIFDTDGSFYMRKAGKNLKQQQPVIDITSYSICHLYQIKLILKLLGFEMWLEKKNRKVRMTGWANTKRFFKEIKPQNNTRIEKFAGVAER